MWRNIAFVEECKGNPSNFIKILLELRDFLVLIESPETKISGHLNVTFTPTLPSYP